MEDEHVFARFFGALKRKWLWALLALVGVALVVVGGTLTGEKKTAAQTAVSEEDRTESYRRALETEIGEMVRALDGVGQARAMVTLSEGERITYSGSRVAGSELPQVCGVAVLCEGGADPAVQAEIVRLLTALFPIGAHRVYVGPLA